MYWQQLAVIAGTVSFFGTPCLSAKTTSDPVPNVVIEWNQATLNVLQDSSIAAPVAARTLALVHTCMYDAWAAYDAQAVGTEVRAALRRPTRERTSENRQQAISYAAYRALLDLFPEYASSIYIPLMRRLGYDPDNRSTDIDTAVGIGNVACGAVLEFRHHDGSNQLGDLAPGQYADWTQYVPRNAPGPGAAMISDPNHWQPLSYVNASGMFSTQRFQGAQWSRVIPFALSTGDQFRSILGRSGPATYGTREYEQQAQELIALSAGLTEEQKAITEYWGRSIYCAAPGSLDGVCAIHRSQRSSHSR